MEFKSGYLLALLSVTSLVVSIVNLIGVAKTGVQASDVALFILAIAVGVLSLRLYAAEKKIYGDKKSEQEAEESQPEEQSQTKDEEN